MDTIKVYHSIWKSALFAAACFGSSAIGIFFLAELPESRRMLVWLCILFFGLGGLSMLWTMLRERIMHTPCYLITDESLILNSGTKTREVRFADVELFSLVKVSRNQMIGIQYKEDVEFLKYDDPSKVGRLLRRFRESVADTQECIPAERLTMKPDVLCDILNERVRSK